MTTIDRRFMAGLAYYMGARELGMGVIRVGNGIPNCNGTRFAGFIRLVEWSFLLSLSN